MNNVMDFKCEKTGMSTFIEQYGCSVWGDLFKVSDDLWLVRFNLSSVTYGNEGKGDKKVLQATEVKFIEADSPWGTLICKGTYEPEE